VVFGGTVARGPLPEAPRVSLLTSARPGVLVGEDGQPLEGRPNELTGGTVPPWIGGYGYRTRACGTAGAGVTCGDDSQTEKVLVAGLDEIVSVVPWYAWAGDVCSSLPNGEDLEARASGLLDASTAHEVEREFWRGDITTAQGWPNPFLADLPPGNALNGGTAVPALAALGALQQALANTGTGGRGMIHATHRTVDAWFASHSGLRREGLTIYDEFDNIVVPGTGYDGSSPVERDGNGTVTGGGETDPAGRNAWAYATDVADVFVGGIVAVGRFPWDVLDRSKNTVETRAERIVAASWERCRHYGINVDLGVAITGIPERTA